MFAKVSLVENEPGVEIPLNKDDTLSMFIVQQHYPSCVGLRYRHAGNLRALRLVDNIFHLPIGLTWSDLLLHCVFPPALKSHLNNPNQINTITNQFDLESFDMLVVGIQPYVSEEYFRQYFEKFGRLDLCELKKNGRNIVGQKFGFIRYNNFDDQQKCIGTKVHELGGFSCTLRLPTSKIGPESARKKAYLSNITPSVTMVNVLQYFSVFGKIKQIFMPPAHSPYAILTFQSESSVSKILARGESHRIFGGFAFVEAVQSKWSSDSAGVEDECTVSENESNEGRLAQNVPPVNALSSHQVSVQNNDQPCSSTNYNVISNSAPVTSQSYYQPYYSQGLQYFGNSNYGWKGYQTIPNNISSCAPPYNPYNPYEQCYPQSTNLVLTQPPTVHSSNFTYDASSSNTFPYNYSQTSGCYGGFQNQTFSTDTYVFPASSFKADISRCSSSTEEPLRTPTDRNEENLAIRHVSDAILRLMRTSLSSAERSVLIKLLLEVLLVPPNDADKESQPQRKPELPINIDENTMKALWLLRDPSIVDSIIKQSNRVSTGASTISQWNVDLDNDS